jgi:MFS family permease
MAHQAKGTLVEHALLQNRIVRFGERVRPDVKNLIVSTGLFSVGYSMLIFTIPLFAVAVGSSESELGFIALVYTLPSFFVPLVVGRFLDKTRAVRVIQIAMAAYAIPTLLFPYGSNFLQVAGIRAAQGFFGIAFWVAAEKELADLAAHGDRGRIMGLYNMSWAAAFVVGPLLGGFLIDILDFKTTFLVTFLWQVAAFVLLILLRPREIRGGDAALASPLVEEKETVLARRWEPGNLVAACLTSGMTGVILGVLFSLFPAYVTFLGFSVLWTGFFMLLFSASRVATFLGVGQVTDRIGERKLMLAGMILSISVMILGLTSKAELLALGLLVLGVASGMTYTAALTLVSRSPSRVRGSAIGKFEFSFNLGIALMSQLGGISADLLGSWSPYVLSGVVTLLGSVALLALYWTMKQSRTQK